MESALDFGIPDFELPDFEAVDLEAADFEAVDFEAVDFEAVDFEAVDFEAVDFETFDFEAFDFEATRGVRVALLDRGMLAPFTPGGEPCADDTGSGSTFDETHHENPSAARSSQQDPAFLRRGVIRIEHGQCHGIAERRRGLGEIDSVLAQVRASLREVPLERVAIGGMAVRGIGFRW